MGAMRDTGGLLLSPFFTAGKVVDSYWPVPTFYQPVLLSPTLIPLCPFSDMKPANVLLKSSNNDPRGFTAKVSDFGLSRCRGGTRRGRG